MKKLILIFSLVALIFVSIEMILYKYFPKILTIDVVISIIYAWIPAVIALYYAKKEKIKLPLFTRPNKYFYLAFLSTILISLIALLISIPFGILDFAILKEKKNGLLGSWLSIANTFFYYYLIFIVALFFTYLGQELFFRGYLWENLKKNPFRAVWLIAFFWSLWMIPTLFSHFTSISDFFIKFISVFVSSFALTPLLLYYRIKGKSILVSTIFYSSFVALPVCFSFAFQSFNVSKMLIYSYVSLSILVIYSLYLKLYLPSFWKSLKR